MLLSVDVWTISLQPQIRGSVWHPENSLMQDSLFLNQWNNRNYFNLKKSWDEKYFTTLDWFLGNLKCTWSLFAGFCPLDRLTPSYPDYLTRQLSEIPLHSGDIRDSGGFACFVAANILPANGKPAKSFTYTYQQEKGIVWRERSFSDQHWKRYQLRNGSN